MNEKIIWTLEEIPIKNLKEFHKNPRQITKEQFFHLSNLIDEFGLIDKPIINKDLTIIGGHQRIKILKKMKEKVVLCQVSNILLDEKQIEKLCIGLNLNQGKFDYDILADLWEPLDLLNYGFTEEQLLGSYKKQQEKQNKENSNSNNKKMKTCPACGHEF